MNRLKSIILTLVLAGSCIWGSAQESSITFLDPDSYQLQYQGEVFAIMADVRLKAEYRGGHIPGAINIPKMKDMVAFVDTLDREISVYVYCTTDTRARSAADYLFENGMQNIYVLEGGLRSWKEAGLPTEKRRKKK